MKISFRKLTLLVFLMSLFAIGHAQNTIYIDPGNSGDPQQNGTIEHPYDSWGDVTFNNGNTYLQKRGTTYTTSGYVHVNSKSNITIGSYGNGERPIIKSGTTYHCFILENTTNCVVKDLDIIATNMGICSLYITGAGSSGNTVDNCEFHDGQWGFRATYGDGLVVKNSEIHHSKDDGMYIQDFTNVEIMNCNIHDVNQNYFIYGENSAGDGIQMLGDCNNFYVHDNIIDRSTTGCKFCFIYNDFNTNPTTGVFENNYCKTAMLTPTGGAGIYIGKGDGIILRGNVIDGPLQGIGNTSANLKVYYNVFLHNPVGIVSLTGNSPVTFYNNTFYDVRTMIKAETLIAKNNIFYFTQSGDKAIQMYGPASRTEDKNLYSWDQGGANAIIGDPQFVNASAGDFHLTPGSIAVNAGVNVGLNYDMDGVLVPQGGAPDVGACEYTSNATNYQLVVNSGSGDGTYAAGSVVNIAANAAPAGKVFEKWTGDVSAVANVSDPTTTVTMPSGNVTLTATYAAVNYQLVVNSGSGDGTYAAGSVVNIAANAAPAGKVFEKWTGDVSAVANVSDPTTTVTMPSGNVTLTATYAAITYQLVVNSGSGDGTYAAGSVVNITANAAPAGKVFEKWTGDVSAVANVNDPTTTVTMPSENVTLTATYAAITYQLVVNSGSGDGSYTTGTVVSITANAAPATKVFDKWSGDIDNIGNINSATTTFTMPSSDAEITATYKDKTFELVVNQGSGDGSYIAGSVVNIAANAAPAGKLFDKWTGDTQYLLNVIDPTTVVNMPSDNVAVTATYKDEMFMLNVVNGSGDGSYVNGTVVSVVANTPPTGKLFSQWTGDVASVGNIYDASTTFTMEMADATITATYADELFQLSVTNGSGDGDYASGTLVDITANAAPAGKVFDRWTGDVQNVVNILDPSTQITMPQADASVSATYKAMEYQLVVNSGSGDGTYVQGTVVNILADAALEGKVFDKWVGDIENIGNVHQANTTIVMPAAHAEVTATYIDEVFQLTVNGGSGDGEYLSGTSIEIIAENAPSGLIFAEWSGDIEFLDNVYSAQAIVVMPQQDVTITANYVQSTYELIVNEGTGSGEYAVGDVVTIVANSPVAGMEFDGWVGDIDYVENPMSMNTILTMPQINQVVTATYRAMGYSHQWTGLVSSQWDEAANWSAGVPGDDSEVFVGGNPQYMPVIETEVYCNALTIALNAKVTIKAGGVLNVTGNMALNGVHNLAITRNAESCGVIINHGQIVTQVENSATVEMDMVAGDWNYLASPMTNALVSSFDDADEYYAYDEPQDTWIDYTQFEETTLLQGKGYAVSYNQLPSNIIVEGNLTSGNVSAPLTYTLSGGRGFTLTGNPYPAYLDALEFIMHNAWENKNIRGSLYFWDVSGNLKAKKYDYGSWNLTGSTSTGDRRHTGNIVPGEAYFVRARWSGVSNGGMLEYTPEMRRTSSGNNKHLTSVVERIYLSLEDKQGEAYNELLVGMTMNATDAFDELYDAEKIKGNENMAFFSVLDAMDLSIQGIAMPVGAREVALGMEVDMAGDYQINLEELQNVSSGLTIHLRDNQTGKVVDLRSESSVAVYLEAGRTAERFVLVLAPAGWGVDNMEIAAPKIYANQNYLYLEGDDVRGLVDVSAADGKVVFAQEITSDTYHKLYVSAQPGVYVVRLVRDNRVYTEKVIIQ